MSSFEMETQMSSKMSSTIFQKVFLGGFFGKQTIPKSLFEKLLKGYFEGI
jgi:hypothetical protein